MNTIGVFLLVTSLLFPLTILDSYGENNPVDVSWQMVYITGNSSCDSFDKLMLETYSGLTSEYLDLYKLQNMPNDIKCLTEQQYDEFELNNTVDLFIIVFDELVGQKVIGIHNFDGFYMHTGNDRSKNHTILMCQCSNFENGFERKIPSWILTHELSHFALSLKGYDFAAVEKFVHLVDKKYDDCVTIVLGICEGRTLLKPPTITKSYLVFPIIKMAVGDVPLQALNEEARNNNIVLGYHKEITRWWLDDMITDDVYLNTTKQVFISPLSLYSGMKVETGVELPNGIILLDHAKEKPINWKMVNYDTKQSLKEKIKPLIDYVPDKMISYDDEPIVFGEIPEFFKLRAQYWIDGKINDKQFFDSIDRLVRMNIIQIN